jgi:hypothetical protein
MDIAALKNGRLARRNRACAVFINRVKVGVNAQFIALLTSLSKQMLAKTGAWRHSRLHFQITKGIIGSQIGDFEP